MKQTVPSFIKVHRLVPGQPSKMDAQFGCEKALKRHVRVFYDRSFTKTYLLYLTKPFNEKNCVICSSNTAKVLASDQLGNSKKWS